MCGIEHANVIFPLFFKIHNARLLVYSISKRYANTQHAL